MSAVVKSRYLSDGPWKATCSEHEAFTTVWTADAARAQSWADEHNGRWHHEEKAAERPQEERINPRTAQLARALIQTANEAAVARYKHEYAMAHPGEVERGGMFEIARSRRELDAMAASALEQYIAQVVEQLRGA